MTRIRLLISVLFLLCFFSGTQTFAQQTATEQCGSTNMLNKWLQNPANKQIHDQVEQQILEYKLAHPENNQPNVVVTLPVVVHIIHNNGPENISDAQAIQGIQHLNQAFANLAPYDPSDGVDCQIQFCLARRDPSGNATNGITRNVSTLTNLNMDYDDIPLKNLNRWNPLCYINIWLVNEISSSGGSGVAGYAYYPSAHGFPMDGIVMESRWFGSTSGNSGITVHEMGHYLGLHHIFQGGCTNNNCLTDGDKVCDTPPDQTTASVPCNGSINSCNTDNLSGFTSDQNDLHRDYMDYGNHNCFSMFTQGQSDRMNWHIQNVRSSLLNCMSCLDPCPAPVTANYTSPGATVNAGSSFLFTNTSVNATSYEWYVNGVLTATTANFNFTFSAIGVYTIKLIAKSSSPLCTSNEKSVTINAVCPVTASFTKSAAVVPCGTNINFTNTSAGATAYEWYVNGVLQATTANYAYTNTTAGRYGIKLIAKNIALNCTREFTDTVEYTCGVIAAFTPGSGNVNINTTVNFTNTSTGATTYQWLVNGLPSATTSNFSYSFNTAGNYSVTLVAGNGLCSGSQTVYYVAVDTCLRQTFQKTYGAAGDEFIQDLRSTPDGGYIAAGRTNSFGAGNYDGLIIKYDDKGVVQWTKTYGGAGLDWLYRVKPITGGGYITIGATGSFGAANADALIIKLDANGNTVWSRRFGENTANGEHGTNVIQTSDGGFLFSGVYNRAGGTASSMLIKLDNNGTVLWNQLYDMGSTDEVASIIEDQTGYIMAGQFRGSTFHDLYMMKVSKANGGILFSKSYDVGGVNSFAYEITRVNNYYEFSFSNSNDFSPVPVNTRSGILRLDTLGNLIHSKFLNAANTTAAGIIIPLQDGGYIAGHSETTNSDLQLFKYNSTGIQQWGAKYVTAGEQLCYAANAAADGGYLAGGLTKAGIGSTSDITFIKTDITGGTPGCTVQPVTAPLANITAIPGTVTFNTRNLNFIAPTNITIQGVTQSLGATQLCSGTTCVTTSSDSCSLNTFRKLYTTPGNEYINDVKNTPDGGFIGVGITDNFLPGSINDGLVIKLDNKGDPLWNKVIGGTGNDVIQRIITTSDGGYMAAGYTGSFGAASAQEGWLVKMDASGNIQWSRKYADGNPNGSVIWDVYQTSDGGYAFCGTNRYTPGLADAMVGKTDANGVLQWCKSFSGSSSDQAWGILEDNGQLIVSAFGVNLGGGPFYDGVLMKLNISTGNVLFARSYDIESRSNWFLYMYKANGKYLVGCNNNNDYTNTAYAHIMLQLDTATGVVNRITRSNTPNDRSGAAAYTPTSDGGYILAQSEIPNSDIHFRKNDNTGSLSWMKQYGEPVFTDRVHGIVQTPDKGFFGGGLFQGPSGYDLMFIKTDAGGNQGGTCTVTADAGDNSAPQYISGLFTWPAITNVSIPQNNTVTPTVTVASLAPIVLCNGPTCTPITDSCSVATFQKIYVGSGDDIAYMTKKAHTGGGYIIGGQSSTNSAGGTDAMLVRTTSDGTIVWAKNYGGTGTDYFADVEQTASGGFIAVGQTRSLGNTNGAAFITYTDGFGGIIWSKALNTSSVNGDLLRDVVQTADGGFAAIGTANSAVGTSDILVIKTDGAGNIQWSRKYATAATDEGSGILEEGDTLVVAGYFLAGISNDPFLMKLNKTNGNIIWAKGMNVDGDNNGLYRIQKIPGGYSLPVPTTAGFTNNNARQIVLKTDVNGNITYAHKLTSATNKPLSDNVIYNLNGGYTSVASEETNGDIHFYSLNNQKQAVWKKRFTRPGTQVVFELAQEPGGYYYMTGTQFTTGVNDIIFIRTDANGNTNGCTMDSTDLLISQPSYGVSNYAPVASTASFATTANINPTVTSISFTVTELCNSVTRCDSLKLNGTDTTCNLSDTLTYTVTRSAGCTAPVFFTVTPSTGLQIISQNDSAIRIKFLQTGQVMIRAKIETPCAVLEDSVLVNIFNSPASLNLGPDINLCSNSIISLHAGPGFKSYKWQDGFADSIYTANFPGTYFVETEDYCGNVFRDTVIINVAPNVVFDLGPNLISCNGDTVTLTAPSGFTSYTWAANYHISSLSGQSVNVWPAVDTVYSVVAEKAPGCLVYDTIRVRAGIAPIIHLGNDTSFCAGNSITLNAGAGFTSYTWSTGATGSTINVNAAGTYWVVGTAANGCQSADTLRVLNVFANPVVNIGADTSLCQGTNLVLNAGNAGASYLWQNGTTAQTLTATATGLYWVQVTNSNGCVARDSMNILNIFTSPVINLGNDTSFCAGNSITLNAGAGFASYNWSTGASGSTITVNTAGTYWVQGTTANGCKSSDTLRVLNVFAVPVVNLGPDTSFCQGYILPLNAGNPGSAYLWQNGTTGQTLSVSTPGLYWVQVTNSNGCSKRDSLRVFNVFPAPVVNIGNDTSFCAGNSITLNAGNAGAGYLWQNGATSQTITAQAAGLYWVQVNNGNNCSTRDSMRVLALYPNPNINLGNDTLLCSGGNLVLDAGAGYASYLWQNNATTQTISVSAVGIYWVRVNSVNGCVASDTIRVVGIGTAPSNFITPQTGMCIYQPFYIHALGNYTSYLWSTGATKDSALITIPGNYWLQVTNNDGCSAREHFVVFDKNCPENVYFPTGFTPNKDGLNDTYKPAVFGTMNNYLLEVYNRYGERVFYTTDYSKGWDGTYKGKTQGVGTFIWMCHYQLKDKDAVFRKGTMVLVR